MEYIIYGAGDDGIYAMNKLSHYRVGAFCDEARAGGIVKINSQYKDKDILSFAKMKERYRTKKAIVVVADGERQTEMVLKLEAYGIERYFVFNRKAFEVHPQLWPMYFLRGIIKRMSYNEALMQYNIKQYHHIAIGVINFALPYLIAEIAMYHDDFCIDYIISDNISSSASKYMGIPIVSFEEAVHKIDCLIINASIDETNIREKIPENPMYSIIDLFDIDQFISGYRHPELVKFKNIHRGKRCFIIGNGPSLRTEDLDKIHESGEISFGTNYIHRLFDKTEWRPTYYMMLDEIGFRDLKRMQLRGEIPSKFFYVDQYRNSPQFISSDEIPKGNIVHQVFSSKHRYNLPKFSDDITKCVYAGWSVIYDLCIQVAAYMGFSEVYLLGIDNGLVNYDNFFDERNHALGMIKENDVNKSPHKDFSKAPSDRFIYRIMARSFRKADQYSRSHGFRIYNATRGGVLEEFERVNFDSLFESQEMSEAYFD